MSLNIGKIGGYNAGVSPSLAFGTRSAESKQPKNYEVADRGLLNRLNSINCELTPNIKEA